MFNTIVTTMKTKVNLGMILMLGLTAYCSYYVRDIHNTRTQLLRYYDKKIQAARVDYAYNVVVFGLKEVHNPAESYELIQMWKTDNWGAQIGAVQILCQYDKTRLDNILTTDISTSVCRITS